MRRPNDRRCARRWYVFFCLSLYVSLCLTRTHSCHTQPNTGAAVQGGHGRGGAQENGRNRRGKGLLLCAVCWFRVVLLFSLLLSFVRNLARFSCVCVAVFAFCVFVTSLLPVSGFVICPPGFAFLLLCFLLLFLSRFTVSVTIPDAFTVFVCCLIILPFAVSICVPPSVSLSVPISL